MQVTALVERADHVCCRYRLTAFRPLLAAAGHRLDLEPLPEHWWSRLLLGKRLRRVPALVVQRRLLPPWLLFLLRRSCRRLLFDFDDAVFLRDSYSPKGLHSSARQRRFAAMARTADAMIAGNAFLADEAARWTDPRRVVVIPTCVEVSRYTPAPHSHPRNEVQLVWVGSASTLQGLHAVRPLLERIGQSCPGLHLKLICDRFFTLDHLPVYACSWSEDSEAAEIAGADIGISFIPSDLWSLGKCGLKVLQYMAAGLPVVANPVGVQAEMIRHGETGFLAETPEQWIDAIARLADSPALRRQMGEAGRQRVQETYSVPVGGRLWAQVLDRLSANEPVNANAEPSGEWRIGRCA